jgi:hypothetical protein
MEKLRNLVDNINGLMADFYKESEAHLNGNKAAGRRARKITSTLTKLLKDYRSFTVEQDKLGKND